MKKLLFKFFPLLVVFFLGGQSTLYANGGEYSNDFSAKKIQSHETAQSGSDDFNFIVKHVLSDITEEDFEICAIDDTESEEEKLISYKKRTEISKYYTSSFYTQALEYFCHHVKKRLSLHKQFLSFISSERYITLRVIRL